MVPGVVAFDKYRRSGHTTVVVSEITAPPCMYSRTLHTASESQPLAQVRADGVVAPSFDVSFREGMLDVGELLPVAVLLLLL